MDGMVIIKGLLVNKVLKILKFFIRIWVKRRIISDKYLNILLRSFFLFWVSKVKVNFSCFCGFLYWCDEWFRRFLFIEYLWLKYFCSKLLKFFFCFKYKIVFGCLENNIGNVIYVVKVGYLICKIFVVF